MNDEIKEILDKAKEISKYGADGKQHTRFFNQFEAKSLLDYITNLQQENERLKETIKHYEDTTTFGDYVKEVNLLIDYKSRCEKAIEYIKNDLQISILPNNQIINGKEVIKRINKIINILQNGSEE